MSVLTFLIPTMVWSSTPKAELWELRCGISAMLAIVLWALNPEDVEAIFAGVEMLQYVLVC